MGCEHGFIQPRQQFQPLGGDLRPHCPPIFALTAAGDQRSLFKPIQQTSNIRVPRDHTVANLPAWKSLRGAPQYAQHVVLGGREIMGLEHLRKPVRESLCRPHHLKVRDLFGG